ncbi:vacuolar protein sorting 33A, putative [Pediculus humanus corporis]|uniref:Vacuolar protein sorting 33A, putative n=1 Tax=Pediculus humanus subsp. corporis TaxID=121224 RepID=E0W3Q6_PEDHC|nr:vacuolar protein sorting 33A, putative [Pediculus humanus corporis]EEB20262.1 vacuolar protein sorting 33A, putative [Pediculus humanus corporis]
MSAHLTTGKINIGQIQELARNKLFTLLDKCDSTKALMWDETLAGPVGLITEYRLLTEHNVNNMFPLKPNFIPRINEKNVIFIVRPSLPLMDIIADYIHGICKEERNKSIRKDFYIFFVPHKSFLCENRLISRGVFGNCTIEEFDIELFPFDNDLLSMENEYAFKELVLENDPTCLYEVAKTLMTIQMEYGIIPQVSGKGHAAKNVWNLMNKMLKEQTSKGCKKLFSQISQIDHLLLIDRSVDLITPMATQLTYEGLIDELFGINNTTAQFPSERFMKTENEPEVLTAIKKQIILNSNDELFADIRDKHFNAVGHVLSRKAKHISAMYDVKPGESVEQMSRFVMQLPQLKNSKRLLAIHTTIAELIKEKTDVPEFLDSLQVEQELLSGMETDKIHSFIEDCIAKKQPLQHVLRLMCLQSLANSGLKPKVLEHYKREIVQTYGFQHLLTLNNLEKAGLLQHQQSSRPYTILRKMLRLTVEDGSEVEPVDISYVHSIYAPISVRLAQHLVKQGGWKSIQDVLGVLPGPTIEGTQVIPTGHTRRGSKGSLSSQVQGDNTRVILVFFIGGCTFAEISALRFLSQQEELNVEFVIATTKLINGNSFLKTIMET